VWRLEDCAGRGTNPVLQPVPEAARFRFARRIAGAHLSTLGIAVRSEEPIAAGFSDCRAHFLAAITEQVRQSGIPPTLAEDVATVESAYDPGARGKDGEVGLMQILRSTAGMLGFQGTNAARSQPEMNIHHGVACLAQAWSLARGNVCRTLMKYRAGYGKERIPSSPSPTVGAPWHI